MTIPISPVNAFPAVATQLRVSDGRVELGAGASFKYVLLSADGKAVSPEGLNALTQSQYDGWTGSDQYVAECVAANLGLTPL